MIDIMEIKYLRKKCGLTQKQLAKLVGVTQSYINKIENGKSEPPYSLGKKIVEILIKKDIDLNISAMKIMTKIRTINQDKTIGDALQRMKELNVSQLPVIDDDKLIVGTISKKTIIRLIDKDAKNIKKIVIKRVMEPPFPMIPKESSIKVVSLLLNFFDGVLLLDKGNFAGIITKKDLLKAIR